MGTITTISYCLVKDGVAYEGTKEEIVHQLCKLRFDKDNTLFIEVRGYQERKYHSYSKEHWTIEEMHKDAITVAFRELIISGFRIYRNIGS